MRKVKIFCDGGSRGNPGPAGIGFIIADSDGNIVIEGSEFIGIRTNNQAEYLAAIKSLEKALSLNPEEVSLCADSELLVKQLKGEYRVRDLALRRLNLKLQALISKLKSFNVMHISRDENLKADRLANNAVDEWLNAGRKIVEFSPETADFAERIVNRGGTIIFPTDTVYGIGCDPTNSKAVEKVSTIKRRHAKPFPILINDLEEALRLGEFSDEALELASRVWPGPLTIVVKTAPEFADAPALFGYDTVGLRMPASAQALEVIKKSGGRLVGTSANITGQSPPRSVENIDQRLLEAVDLTIDSGRTPIGEPSTVIRVYEKRIELLREGAVKLSQLRKLIDDVGLSLEI